MKVECVTNILDGVEYDLTRGELYEVLGIEADDLRVLDDAGRPYLFARELFRVVDPVRPKEWVSETADGVEYAYAPELAATGFFEDYFDGRPEAVRAFSRYINRRLRLTDAA